MMQASFEFIAFLYQFMSILLLMSVEVFTQFFNFQLADKNDTPLIQKIVACGVEFSVVKASFQGVLYNILLSAVAVWLPLFPLIFLVKRILEERSGNSK